jgi:hypothetical protein
MNFDLQLKKLIIPRSKMLLRAPKAAKRRTRGPKRTGIEAMKKTLRPNAIQF